jgi:RNA polymerase sigma factor (sigma-70 family)
MTRIALRYCGDSESGKDIVIESFTKVFNSIDSFEYRGDGSLRAWISRIVVNQSLMTIRKKSRWLFGDIEEAENIETTNVEIDIAAEELYDLIRKLPDGCRLVFNMFVIEGYSHDEIATAMNITAGTSRSQLAHARKLLKNNIERYEREFRR